MATHQMGVSLSAWRAAIGTFLITSRDVQLTPNQKHYDYTSYFTRRREWARYVHSFRARSSRKSSTIYSFALVILPWVLQCILLISNDVHPNPGPPVITNFDNLSICHSNIRSLKQVCYDTGEKIKLNDINCHLTNYDIITVSETWLTPNEPDDIGYRAIKNHFVETVTIGMAG